jgi:hypothetical protein
MSSVSAPVAAQLRTGDGSCWQANYDQPLVSGNGLKARSR